MLITGGGLLFVLLVLPGGLATALIAVRDRLLGVAARRRGIDLTPAAAGTSGVDAAVEPVRDQSHRRVTAALLRCTDCR